MVWRPDGVQATLTGTKQSESYLIYVYNCYRSRQYKATLTNFMYKATITSVHIVTTCVRMCVCIVGLLAVAGGQDLTILSTKTGVVKWAHTLNLADE